MIAAGQSLKWLVTCSHPAPGAAAVNDFFHLCVYRPEMMAYGIAYLGAMLAVLAIVPVCSFLATKMKILDRPGTRKVHLTAVPRIGGVAVLAAVLGGALVMFLTGQFTAGPTVSQMTALLLTGALVCGIGLIDDIWKLRAHVKLLGQIVAALCICWFGIRIESIGVAGLFELKLAWLAWPVTVAWIVGITNAVNLIDGLDGLAAGISAIACVVMAAFAFWAGQHNIALLMVLMLGGLSGFLFFNFNPAKMFLGDCGSMFLGFFLATVSVISASRAQSLAGMALPVLALGVPIFDTLFTILRRLLDRRSMFAPDRGHIHHRMINSGLDHRRAVLVIYAMSLASGLVGLLMLLTRGVGRLAVFAAGLALLVLVFRHFGAIRFREALFALQRNRAMAREARGRRRTFEEMQLRLREASTVQQWWKVVRRAARYLGLSRAVVHFRNGDGLAHQLTWSLPGRAAAGRVINAHLPVCRGPAGLTISASVEIPVNKSLESAGSRLTLFGRLMDERPVGELEIAYFKAAVSGYSVEPDAMATIDAAEQPRGAKVVQY